eukprot:GFYU01029364.1.p1 GENE.GFYU01029364.1~~GFYU01029364.1.p1  ORF type:complete len:603 (-),score=83.94 GFYU01029364.1:109-1917(-)
MQNLTPATRPALTESLSSPNVRASGSSRQFIRQFAARASAPPPWDDHVEHVLRDEFGLTTNELNLFKARYPFLRDLEPDTLIRRLRLLPDETGKLTLVPIQLDRSDRLEAALRVDERDVVGLRERIGEAEYTKAAKSWKRLYLVLSAADSCKVYDMLMSEYGFSASSARLVTARLTHHVYNVGFERVKETLRYLRDEIGLNNSSIARICKARSSLIVAPSHEIQARIEKYMSWGIPWEVFQHSLVLRPSILLRDVDALDAKAESTIALHIECGLDEEAAWKMMRASGFLNVLLPLETKSIAESVYTIASALHIDPAEVLVVARTSPSVVSCSTANIHQSVDVLKEAGYSMDLIRAMYVRRPSWVGNVRRDGLQVLSEFAASQGSEPTRLLSMSNHFPYILSMDRQQAEASLQLLKDLYGGGLYAMEALSLAPTLLHKHTATHVKSFLEYGLTEDHVRRILQRYPLLVLCSPKRLRANLESMRGLGLIQRTLVNVLVDYAVVLQTDPTLIRRRIQVLKKHNLLPQPRSYTKVLSGLTNAEFDEEVRRLTSRKRGAAADVPDAPVAIDTIPDQDSQHADAVDEAPPVKFGRPKLPLLRKRRGKE